MKVKDISPITQRITSEIHGFATKGLLVFVHPHNGILRGFCFDGSDFDKTSFYVWAFVQPLYVPQNHVGFNLGKRLGGGSGKRWQITGTRVVDEVLTAIKTDGLQFIQPAATPSDLAVWTRSLPNANDPYVTQARAYSLAAAHCDADARKALAQLISILDIRVPWMAIMAERAKQLAVLVAKGPDHVDAKLREWQSETKSHLEID